MRIVTFPAGMSARQVIREMIMIADPNAVTEIRVGIWRVISKDMVFPLDDTSWIYEAHGMANAYGLRLNQDDRGVWRLKKMTYIRPEEFYAW